jgi:hypothetical protein
MGLLLMGLIYMFFCWKTCIFNPDNLSVLVLQSIPLFNEALYYLANQMIYMKSDMQTITEMRNEHGYFT